jgi:hypothetical protein
MDPAVVGALGHALPQIIACVMLFGTPIAIVFMNKHFKLKNRELELEAQLHSKELELRLRSLEARQAAVETALGAIGARPAASLEERVSLVEPGSSVAEAAPDPQRLRSR